MPPAAAPLRDERAILFDDVVRALSLALDFDEGEKLFHAWRVALLAVRLGRRLGMGELEWLFFGGLLHDVGGMGLSDHVLHAARGGFRSARAREHSAEGARIVRPFSLLSPIAPLIADHHERFDGKGFPLGKSGPAVAGGAYVIAAADHLDVALRGGDFEARLTVAAGVARSLRGAAWPAETGDALVGLIEEEPETLRALFDEARLRTEMDAVRFSPPGIERFTKADILSQLLWVFARAIDAKHGFTLGHSYRVTRLARAVARGLGSGAVGDWDLVCAGLLHDVGMLGVPRSVLRREGALGPGERGLLRRHPLDTEAIVGSIHELRPLARPAAAHHEHHDGSGYPWGLAGDEIPLLGRILALADRYDGMRSPRPHREGLSHGDALARLRAEVGMAIDPHLADAALAALERCGAAWPWPDEAADVRRLFEAESPDATRVLPRDGRERVLVPQGPRGAVLYEIAPWLELELGAGLELLRGRQTLAALLGADPGPGLQDALDDESGRRLAAWLAAPPAAEEPPLATVVLGRSGTPLEIVARRRGAGAELLVRSAEDRAQTMKQLAFFYRNFLSGAEAALFTDREGRIIEANRPFLDLYGWRLEELAGAPPPAFRAPSFAELALKAERAPGGAWHGEVLTFDHEGRPLPALFTLVAVRDAAGAPLGLAGRLVDIRERKRLEAELQRKNEELEALSRLKSDLIAITSHDLKSPLASLTSYAELVKLRLSQGRLEQVPEYVDRMAQLGDRMARLIHDILSLRKIESGTFKLELRPTSLAEVLGRCADLHALPAAEKGVALSVRAPPALAPCPLDPERLEQVFNNLVANALRYSPAGSAVELGVEVDGERLRARVSDRGPGIPKEEQALIFDRYHQVKRGQGGVSARSYNVGLGLAIARSIVELHRGRIWVEDRVGGGCSFVVELPARAAGAGPSLPAALLLDAGGILVERLAPSLAAKARVERARDLGEAARLVGEFLPAVVFAHGASMDPAVVAWADGLAGPQGRRPTLVEVHDGEAPESGLADRTLVLPVLDVEVLELLRELDAR